MSEGTIKTHTEKMHAAEIRTSANRRKAFWGIVTAGAVTAAGIIGINAMQRPSAPDHGNSTPETIVNTNELIFRNVLKPYRLARQVEVDLAKVNIREGKPELDNAEDGDDSNIIISEQIIEANGVPVDSNRQIIRIGNATIVQGESSNSPLSKEPYVAMIVKVRNPLSGFTDLKRAFINISDNTSTGVKIDRDAVLLTIRGDDASGFKATSASGSIINESNMNVVTVVPKPSEGAVQSPNT